MQTSSYGDSDMQMNHSLTKMKTLVIRRPEHAQARNHIGVVTAYNFRNTLLHIKHCCLRYNRASEKNVIEFKHKPTTVNSFACL